jgi:hypothetical protein
MRGRLVGVLQRLGGSGRAAPQEVGELDRQLDPLTDLVGACCVMGRALQVAGGNACPGAPVRDRNRYRNR